MDIGSQDLIKADEKGKRKKLKILEQKFAFGDN